METEAATPTPTEETPEVVVEEEPEEEAKEKEPLVVEILPVIKEAQQQHGLRHGDYQRYRQYCTRRLKRVRNSLHFKLGTRHGFKGKKITEENCSTDSRFLYMLLVEAERCWGAAMELKLRANTEPRKKFHMIRKLSKASKYAEELVKLSEMDGVDARTKLEAQAYSSWMTANLKFEVQDWQTAISLYTQSRSIYEKLSGAFMDESLKSLYLQRVEEIGPNIRYCAYNLGQGGMDINDLMKMRSSAAGQDMLASKIDAAIKETREKLASSFGEVTWRGKTVPIRNEKARVFILRMQDKETEVGRHSAYEGKMDVYDNLLMDCKDTLQVVNTEIGNEAKTKKNESSFLHLQFVRTYISYLRQRLLIERNLLMIESSKEKLPALIGQTKSTGKGKASKPEDLVRLYDGIIQGLQETGQLSGLEEDEEMAGEVDAQIIAYKAFRCFYIAQSYQHSKKWVEAVTLYDRVIKYVDEATLKLKACDNPVLNTLVTKIGEVAEDARGHKYAAHAASILESSDTLPETMAKVSLNTSVLTERLDTYQEYKSIPKKPNLVHFPPEPTAVPCKPLFFDLALNHVDLPDLKGRMEKEESGGITGLVGRWLWGK